MPAVNTEAGIVQLVVPLTYCGLIDKLEPKVQEYEVGQRVGVGWPAGITYDGGGGPWALGDSVCQKDGFSD